MVSSRIEGGFSIIGWWCWCLAVINPWGLLRLNSYSLFLYLIWYMVLVIRIMVIWDDQGGNVTKITTYSNRLHIATSQTQPKHIYIRIWRYGNLTSRGGAGRSTLANQGSLYHASWRPRLPNVFESGGGQKTAEARGPLLEGGWRKSSLHACNLMIQYSSICLIDNRPKLNK